MVCDDDTGSPRHHVARFQMTAAMSSANTMVKPEPLLTRSTSSTGRMATMVKATAPELVSTPTKFHKPDQITAMCGSSECV